MPNWADSYYEIKFVSPEAAAKYEMLLQEKMKQRKDSNVLLGLLWEMFTENKPTKEEIWDDVDLQYDLWGTKWEIDTSVLDAYEQQWCISANTAWRPHDRLFQAISAHPDVEKTEVQSREGGADFDVYYIYKDGELYDTIRETSYFSLQTLKEEGWDYYEGELDYYNEQIDILLQYFYKNTAEGMLTSHRITAEDLIKTNDYESYYKLYSLAVNEDYNIGTIIKILKGVNVNVSN